MTPKNNMIQSTPVFAKPPKETVIQSKLADQIVTTIHTKKKQPTIDNDCKDKYDAIPEQIRDTGKKIHPTRTEMGNKKLIKYYRGTAKVLLK